MYDQMNNLFNFMLYWLFYIGLNLLKSFNIIKITLSKQCNYLYCNVDIVKGNVDNVMRFIYNIKAKLVKYRLEPFDNTWTSISYIKNGLYEENGYIIEDYDDLEYPSTMSGLVSDFDGSYKFAKNTLSHEITEYLVFLKSRDFWLSRICNSNINDYNITLTHTPKFFLSVEYIHPDMEHKINIEIDPLLYLDQNELFSYVFVLRCLEYQPLPYIFDSEYKLNIMDNEIKFFELNSNQYIKLNKTGYTVTNSDIVNTAFTLNNLKKALNSIMNIDSDEDTISE